MKVEVKQEKDQPEIPTEIIAQAIIEISMRLKKLRSGRLNDRALKLLIQHASPNRNNSRVAMADIDAVLSGIENLEKTYIRKKI